MLLPANVSDLCVQFYGEHKKCNAYATPTHTREVNLCVCSSHESWKRARERSSIDVHADASHIASAWNLAYDKGQNISQYRRVNRVHWSPVSTADSECVTGCSSATHRATCLQHTSLRDGTSVCCIRWRCSRTQHPRRTSSLHMHIGEGGRGERPIVTLQCIRPPSCNLSPKRFQQQLEPIHRAPTSEQCKMKFARRH